MKFAFGGAAVPSLGKKQERVKEDMKKKSLLFLHLTLTSYPTCNHLIKNACKLHLWGWTIRSGNTCMRTKQQRAVCRGQSLIRSCMDSVLDWILVTAISEMWLGGFITMKMRSSHLQGKLLSCLRKYDIQETRALPLLSRKGTTVLTWIFLTLSSKHAITEPGTVNIC